MKAWTFRAIFKQTIVTLGAACVALLATGCGSKQSNDSVDLHALYSSDIAAFSNIDSNQTAIQQYDQSHRNLFTQAFGGTKGADVLSYYQSRIQHAYTKDEFDQATLNNIYSLEGYVGASSKVPSAANGSKVAQAQLGAINVTAGLWLDAIVAGMSAEVEIQGNAIPLNSSHDGIMVFGPGYQAFIKDSLGNKHDVPPEFRQAILVHEARHSDCTGGVSSSDLATIRASSSEQEWMGKLPNFHCTHSHIICPQGHDYAGLPACDSEPYGAYGIESIFAAALANTQSDEVWKKEFQAKIIDSQSRFIDSGQKASGDAMPDMSSTGLVQ